MNATKFIRIEAQIHKALRIRAAQRELTIAWLASHYIVAGIRAEREAREKELAEHKDALRTLDERIAELRKASPAFGESQPYVPDTPAVAEAQRRIREAMTDAAAAEAEENLMRVIEEERAKVF